MDDMILLISMLRILASAPAVDAADLRDRFGRLVSKATHRDLNVAPWRLSPGIAGIG